MEQTIEITITPIIQTVTVTVSSGIPGPPGVVDYNMVIAYSVAL